MVQGKLVRSINEDRQRPRLLRAAVQFSQRCFDVSGLYEDDTIETAGRCGTIVRHPAMIGLINGRLQTHVVDCRPGAKPTGWKHEIHIDAFAIHVFDAHRRIALAKRIGLAVLMPLVTAHILFVFRGVLVGGSEPALIMACAHKISDCPFFVRGLVPIKLVQLCPHIYVEIGLEQIRIGPHVSVGVKNLEPIASH